MASQLETCMPLKEAVGERQGDGVGDDAAAGVACPEENRGVESAAHHRAGVIGERDGRAKTVAVEVAWPGLPGGSQAGPTRSAAAPPPAE
ncbi:MAG: hypothetical protein ACOYZ7_04085 [Chloroflexota bacterium]